jgi:hypothetical protein
VFDLGGHIEIANNCIIGVTGGMAGIEERARPIARLVVLLPVSVKVTTNDRDEILSQARTFSAWANNINVKVTI